MLDPETSRFLQEDTYTGDKKDPLSLNLYTYCHNNPLIYDDPTGHFAHILFSSNTSNVQGINKQLLTGAEWNEYFKDTYGKGNVEWKVNSKYDPTIISDIYSRRVKGELQLEHPQSKQASSILSDELEEVGILKPQFPTQAHHLIPHGQAKEAIIHLEMLGINRNSSANGVRLPALYISSNPQAIHSAQYSGMMKHGQRYIYEVTNNIMRCNTKVEAIEYLTRLRRRLLDGTINLYE